MSQMSIAEALHALALATGRAKAAASTLDGLLHSPPTGPIDETAMNMSFTWEGADLQVVLTLIQQATVLSNTRARQMEQLAKVMTKGEKYNVR